MPKLSRGFLRPFGRYEHLCLRRPPAPFLAETHLPSRLCAFAALVALAACSGGGAESPDAGEWQSETTSEGNVTTVRTISGSIWGGVAQLEEELSIGVESGEDAYMLGQVQALAEDDGEIFVLDRQVPVVRVYDSSGVHLRDLGKEGQGPGELQSPESMVIGPDGRIYIRDPQNGRVMILDKNGEEQGIIRITSSFHTSTPMVMTQDGTLYNYQLLEQDVSIDDWQLVMVPLFEDEEMEGEPIRPPEFDFEEWQIIGQREGNTSINRVPFSPDISWTLSPSGAVVGGVSDDYSFEIHYPDGRVTAIEKSWEPVPVNRDEGTWYKKQATANMLNSFPGWVWNGREVPSYKPAFNGLFADNNGRIWVMRPGPGVHLGGDCIEDPEPGEPFYQKPCWRQTTTWEVFDEEGRYLGGAELPEGIQSRPAPFIRDDMFLASFTDEAGTVMVKRFRITPPAN